MNYLVDTNILTRMADPAHTMHQEALDAVTLLIGLPIATEKKTTIFSVAYVH